MCGVSEQPGATSETQLPSGDGGGQGDPGSLRGIARLAVPALGDAQADYDRIGFGVEALVFAVSRDGAPAYRARVDAEILRFSRRQNTRERTWFAGNGFDPRPEEIGSIAEMFVK